MKKMTVGLTASLIFILIIGGILPVAFGADGGRDHQTPG